MGAFGRQPQCGDLSAHVLHIHLQPIVLLRPVGRQTPCVVGAAGPFTPLCHTREPRRRSREGLVRLKASAVPQWRERRNQDIDYRSNKCIYVNMLIHPVTRRYSCMFFNVLCQGASKSLSDNQLEDESVLFQHRTSLLIMRTDSSLDPAGAHHLPTDSLSVPGKSWSIFIHLSDVLRKTNPTDQRSSGHPLTG